ncbi:UDP-N-acetylmuramoyl-L-alanine--D-glutamate ligase [Candidatus Peregrinibacteria bacterium]|nr:UDP-N-acetylmuramoyl-L-alanine--D-glutamate ligase [Candidatus Peregrinibacteria bacterium]
MKIEDLKEKRILILGLGKEGLSSYKFLRDLFPEKEIGLADQKMIEDLSSDFREAISEDNNYKLHLGADYLDVLRDYDVIIKSPGINPRLYGIEQALEKGVVLTSNTKIFFENRKGFIIAVTGSKGKSTICSMLYEMLRRDDFKVSLIGNIGFSALDYLKHDSEDRYYVFEISSYQLEDFDNYPDIGVFTSFFREHIDYHKNEDNYFEAKTHLFKRMPESGVIFFNGNNKRISNYIENLTPKKIDFLDTKKHNLARIINNNKVRKIKLDEGFVLDKDKVKLLGNHNLANIICAAKIARFLGVADETVLEVAENFSGLKHRLEFVGRYKSIDFYDDAISTTPESTMAAIEAFDGKISTLILGGMDRGYDFKKLAKMILHKQIENLILFPDSGEVIWKDIKSIAKSIDGLLPKLPKHYFVTDMKSCVEKAYKVTRKNKICLLSCASPSFGIFKNFEDKGNQFVEYIHELS